MLTVSGPMSIHPAFGQLRTDWQIHSVATVAATTFVGGGVGLTVRPADRLRLSVVASGGVAGQRAAVRGEALVTVPADPTRTAGVGVYAGGGIAAMGTANGRSAYLVLLVGLERAPGAAGGWFVEAGLGGGARLLLGYRMRSRGRNS